MPRYYFHVEDGRSPPDQQGTVLEDLQAAREYAVQYAGDVLRDEAGDFLEGDNWRIVACNQVGLALFEVSVSLNQDPDDRPF